MAYYKFPACRICCLDDHKTVSDIDFKLLNGASVNEIIGQYGKFFIDKEKPLTYISVVGHRKHMSKNIGASLLGLPEASSIPSGAEIVVGDRAEGFDSYIENLKRSKETLDAMIASAFEDLNASDAYLAKSDTPKYQALMLAVRDNIRKSIANITQQIQETSAPNLNQLNTRSDPRIVELLMIVKKAATLSIRDETVKKAFRDELTIQIAQSRELKWLAEDQK